MIALNAVILFLAEASKCSTAHFVAKRGLLRAEGGGHPLTHLMDDFKERSQSKQLQNRTAALHSEAPMASALRLKPEYFNKLVSYFEYLDSEPKDQKLSLMEFMQVARYDVSLREDGHKVYDLFSVADNQPGMTLQEFVRLVTIVTETPGGFDYDADDLKALPSSTIAEEQDRDALMRLFAVFDENTNGNIDKAEFEHAWMGESLWYLRYEGILSSRWMATTPEYNHAKGIFAQTAGADNVLSLAEFAQLCKASVKYRDSKYAKGGELDKPKKLDQRPMSASSHSFSTWTAFFITFAFGALISFA